MHRLIHNSCRAFLAATAFTMVFLLTPRVWVGGDVDPRSETIPVDRLERPGTCLWCDGAPPPSDEECRDADDDQQLWLNPDDPRPRGPSEECDDSPSADPNA